jgi:hypothetical protein
MLKTEVDNNINEEITPLESGLSLVKIIDCEIIAVEMSKAPKNPRMIRSRLVLNGS